MNKNHCTEKSQSKGYLNCLKLSQDLHRRSLDVVISTLQTVADLFSLTLSLNHANASKECLNTITQATRIYNIFT